MSRNIPPVTGMKDVLSADIGLWQHVERSWRTVADAYGYEEIRVPVVEHTELFKRAIGEYTDVVEKEMYTFTDQGGDSWVEVYDSRGERLFYDVASAGSVQSVTGNGPLRVVLGNAAGVSVEVDGQAREIPEGAGDGEGARFVVNRSGSLSRAR